MKITANIVRIQFWPLRIVLWNLYFPFVALEYLLLALFHGLVAGFGRALGALVMLGTMYVVGIIGFNAKNEPTHLE